MAPFSIACAANVGPLALRTAQRHEHRARRHGTRVVGDARDVARRCGPEFGYLQRREACDVGEQTRRAAAGHQGSPSWTGSGSIGKRVSCEQAHAALADGRAGRDALTSDKRTLAAQARLPAEFDQRAHRLARAEPGEVGQVGACRRHRVRSPSPSLPTGVMFGPSAARATTIGGCRSTFGAMARWRSVASAMRWNTGAATAPPK